MDPGVSVQKQDFTRNPEKLAKVPGTREEAESHLHWQFLGIWQSLPGSLLESLHVYTTPIGDWWGCWQREQCVEWKKGPLPCCCNQVCMKIGRQIPWNAKPICETFKISCLMGNHHTRDVLGNHIRDQSFRLVYWLRINLFLWRTSQESINLERKFYLDCSLDTLCTRGWNMEGWRTGRRPWGVGNDGRIGNLLEKTQCERGGISQRKWINLFFQPQMDESNFLVEIRNWEHPPWYGSTQFEENVEGIFLENQKGLFHHLTTRFRMLVKRWMILVHFRKLHMPPSRRTQSQTLLAESVRTTPQRTRFRDVQQSIIMATVWVDDDKIKSDYNIKKKTWNYVCAVKPNDKPMTTWQPRPTQSTWNATPGNWIAHLIAWLKLSPCLHSSHPCMQWASLFDFELSIPSNVLLFLFSFNLEQLLLPFNFHEDT